MMACVYYPLASLTKTFVLLGGSDSLNFWACLHQGIHSWGALSPICVETHTAQLVLGLPGP